ncbi:hypothetical protein [Chamaesiphon sp. VAR_48_metabat_135_sub]|uniref:hypothetical protein n=1 Tax=Chamaesiphon sp. VAR_48_metabat_135_sub TaxID=2964699 RepID=UPI00286BDE7E|nr:hypothetical protein [Chamaesiphon sp. VAR_48_metabat_135_sub]
MQAKQLFNKRSIYPRSILVIAILSIVFWLPACNANKNGAANPDRVVEQYLLALENRDKNLMLRLIPENVPISEEIKAKIVKFGGRKIQERQIKYTKYKPILWSAKISGFYVDRNGIRSKFDDSISIEYQSKGHVKLYGGRWYLLLDP